MKPLITAIGICGLLFAGATAYGAPVDFVWDGGTSRAWQTPLNWTADSGAPGDDVGDTATIDADPNSRQPRYGNAAGNRTIASLTLNSETNSVTVSLNIVGNDTFTVSGTTTVLADADAANNATIMLGAAVAMDFDPGDLVLDGGDKVQAANGQALFDYDAGTLSDPDSLTMRGDSKVDAEDNITLDSGVDGTLTVDADTFATDAVIDMLSGKTFTAASVVIGNATQTTKLTILGSGKLITN